jgi:hypothetical protein
MKLTRRILVALGTLVVLALPASAFAGVSSGGVLGDDTAGGTAGSGGALPFTGLQLLPIVAVGAALLIVGAVLRRRSKEDAAS